MAEQGSEENTSTNEKVSASPDPDVIMADSTSNDSKETEGSDDWETNVTENKEEIAEKKEESGPSSEERGEPLPQTVHENQPGFQGSQGEADAEEEENAKEEGDAEEEQNAKDEVDGEEGENAEDERHSGSQNEFSQPFEGQDGEQFPTMGIQGPLAGGFMQPPNFSMSQPNNPMDQLMGQGIQVPISSAYFQNPYNSPEMNVVANFPQMQFPNQVQMQMSQQFPMQMPGQCQLEMPTPFDAGDSSGFSMEDALNMASYSGKAGKVG